MAEALRTDKAEDGAHAACTAFLDNPVEIAKALITLRNQRAKLQITFEKETILFSARILDVLEDELLLEDVQPRSALKLMSNRRRFSFSGRAQGVYLHAENNRVSRVEEDQGVPYFRVPLPTHALFQQRRRRPRYELPLRTDAHPASVTLARNVRVDKDHGVTLSGRMLDVSASGCRVAIPGPVHPPLEPGEALASTTILIPARYDLKVQTEVRHASYNKLSRTVICGLEFTGMHITDRRRLEQFMRSLISSPS